jgi:UDP-N-acetylmuramoyl-tripeptide--D-alanyl-D-alanine ligase
LINDAWNAHPISVRAALEHLAERAGDRRRVAVLGQMAELGEYASEAHLEVARAVDEVGVDALIAVGPEARVYGGRWVPDAASAVEELLGELRPGDCVLVKGARALGLETVAEALTAVKA